MPDLPPYVGAVLLAIQAFAETRPELAAALDAATKGAVPFEWDDQGDRLTVRHDGHGILTIDLSAY